MTGKWATLLAPTPRDVKSSPKQREADRKRMRKWREANQARALESSRVSMRKLYYKQKAERKAALRKFYLDHPEQDRRGK